MAQSKIQDKAGIGGGDPLRKGAWSLISRKIMSLVVSPNCEADRLKDAKIWFEVNRILGWQLGVKNWSLLISVNCLMSAILCFGFGVGGGPKANLGDFGVFLIVLGTIFLVLGSLSAIILLVYSLNSRSLFNEIKKGELPYFVRHNAREFLGFELILRRQELRDRLIRFFTVAVNALWALTLGVTLLGVILAIGDLANLKPTGEMQPPLAIGTSIVICFFAAGFCVWSYALRTSANDSVEAVRDTEVQYELATAKIPKELKNLENAHKLLKLNEHHLFKYYRLNLRQNSVVFFLGMISMMMGFVIIGITLFIVSRDGSEETGTDYITAVLGGVGALLSNFIAVIFLQMHARASEALTQLHKRLAESNSLLLANVMASSIVEDKLRMKTLADLSRIIGGRMPGLEEATSKPGEQNK